MCIFPKAPKVEAAPIPPTDVKPDVSNITAAVRENVAKRGLASQMSTTTNTTANVLRPAAGGLAPNLSSKTGGGA